MGTIDWQSDNLITMAGPVMATTGLPPSETPSGGVSAKLFDTALDCRLSASPTKLSEEHTTGAVFTVDSVAFMKPGGLVTIDLGDGRFFEKEILSVSQPDVTMTTDLNTVVPAGNIMKIETYGIGISFLGLDNAESWETNMVMSVVMDDGTTEDFTINAADQNNSLVFLSGSTTALVSPGAIAKRKIGPDVTMTAFGTFPTSNPTPGDPTWGFRGTINHDHADLALGLRLRAEITFEDGTTNIRRKVIGTVINS
jgi:hypothetical protein